MNSPDPGLDSPSPAPKRRGVGWLPWLVLLVLLAAAGWFGWPWVAAQWDQIHSERKLLVRLGEDVSRLDQRVKELGGKQLNLSERVDSDAERLGQMAQSLDGGRGSLRLAAVEQLLLMANDQLLLAHDVRSARRTLDEADHRLAGIEDPGLLPVRQLLARERAALAALPDVDRAGPSLMLGALIRQAPEWPLRARAVDPVASAPPAAEPAAAESWSGRLWNSVTRALAQMFTVRRNQGPSPRFLPPGEESLVARALALKLEGARLAVLSGDAPAIEELCKSAGDWLQIYYNDADPAVAAARRQLGELAKAAAASGPASVRPDISGSLARLRQIMGQRSVR